MNTSRNMTAEDLAEVGRFLFGDNWRGQLADALRVTPQAVHAWARPKAHKDARRIPGPATAALDLLMQAARAERETAPAAPSVESLFD